MDVLQEVVVFFLEPVGLPSILVVLMCVWIVALSWRMARLGVRRTSHSGEQEHLIASYIEAQESERTRIAADLHDNIISKLTVIRLSASANVDHAEIDMLLGNAIEETRQITHDLSPSLYEGTALKELLITKLRRWQKQFEVIYRTDIRVQDNLDVRKRLQVVRIFQEILTNIYKHAHASKISLTLRMTSTSFTMIIEDDGLRFDNQRGEGLGLQNIRMRAQNLNAKYKFKPNSIKGNRFVFSMRI